jgi:NAD(P)-dependent dehydrogenase (short-subunit alcohol dehydrogenase family)
MDISSTQLLDPTVEPEVHVARGDPPRATVEVPQTRPTALVTGATDGIGRAVSHRLAGLVDTLLVHGRSPQPLAALAAALAPANPGTCVVPVVADLGCFADVERLIQRVRTTYGHLDILVNNAATVGQYSSMLTEDGHELAFQVNYLAPAFLTAGLFDLLLVARRGRVVNVVCDAYRNVSTFDQDSLGDHRYHPAVAYAQSKFALVAHTASLVSACAGTRLTAVCVDPGFTETKLQRTSFGWPGASVSAAADNVLYAVTKPVNDRGFYVRGKEIVQPVSEVLQIPTQRRLDKVTGEVLDMSLPWTAMGALRMGA